VSDSTAELPGLPPRVRTRTGLLHPIAHYVGLYGSQERTIKIWMKKGRDAQDLCPLDDPAALVEWWKRRMTWSVPDRLMAAAAQVQVQAPALVVMPDPTPEVPAQAPETPKPPVAAGPAKRQAVDVASIEGFTFLQVVEQLRKTAAVASLEYGRAMSDSESNEALLSLKLKALNSSAEQLRKAEKDLAELQRERGDVVARLDWERDTLELLRLLRSQHERMADRIAERVPEAVRDVVRAAVLEVRQQEEFIFRNLITEAQLAAA